MYKRLKCLVVGKSVTDNGKVYIYTLHLIPYADGRTVTRKVSECYIVLPQGEAHTPVILGEPGDEALLGVVTLEILGFVLNPFTRELQPMRMLLI